ncbi:MAG: hypothetical protein ABI045_00045 [Flavobacteriales bacterium]
MIYCVVLNEVKMLGAISFTLGRISTNSHFLFFISPFLGMINEFITGSNLVGSILVIHVQQGLGNLFDRTLLLRAFQNSAA